jgi:hypothetical protein
MSDLGAQIIKRKESLRSLRTVHEDTWIECLDHSFPIRANGFFGDGSSDTGAAKAKRARLMDSTATDAGRTQASSIQSGMTPANSRWFTLAVGHETDEEKRWLDESGQLLWENIHAGNFDAAAFECFLDMIAVGWFALFIDVDRERGGLRFEQWPINTVYCASSKKGGQIDTIYRDFELTVEQCVNDYGIDAVSDKVRQLYQDGKLDEKIKLVQAIYPRSTYAVGAQRAKNLPFASCHVEVESKKLVRESGFHELPVVVPRWVLIPNSVYAVGPMFDVLPDVKELNRLLLLEDAAAELAVAGMWIAEDDGVLNPRTVRVGARKIIVANSVDSMKPLLTGSDFKVSFTKKEMLQAQIRKMLMADQLQPQDGPAMTATEVHVRVQLIRQLLGPVYGRLQAEYLKPLIERCFGLAYRAGVFNPPPESLAGRDFHIVYVSPLAKAQKLEEVSAIQNTLMLAGEIAKVLPNVLDNIDGDEALRQIADGNGAPQTILRNVKDRDALRHQREQAQQQQIQQAHQQAVTEKVAPQLVKNAA